MTYLRPVFILLPIGVLTLVLLPLQLVFVLAGMGAAKRLPVLYHRLVCRILGIRIHRTGTLAEDKPTLLLCNHISWLDIPVLSTLGGVSFVAKKEIAGWPVIGWLARLQRTVFVNRTRRSTVGQTTSEITQRLAGGDHIVLFPEGTSGDGNHILPFRSALLAAVKPSRKHGGNHNGDEVYVQTVTIAYTGLGGLPLGRRRRHIVAWYGDMDMLTHMWQLLGYGPLDVQVKINPPVPLDDFADRKALAQFAHEQIKRDMAALLTGRPVRPTELGKGRSGEGAGNGRATGAASLSA